MAPDDPDLTRIAEILEPPISVSFDLHNKLDQQFAQWLLRNTLPEDYSKGLNVGVLQYWIQQTTKVADGSWANVNPFAVQALDQWFTDNQAAWEDAEERGTSAAGSR